MEDTLENYRTKNRILRRYSSFADDHRYSNSYNSYNDSLSTVFSLISSSVSPSPSLFPSSPEQNGSEEYEHGGEEYVIDDLYQVPLGIVLMLSVFYGGISLAAVAGNGLVLWVVSVSRRMRTVTNLFIANLALADISIGLFAIPFQFQAALLQRWNLPNFMCGFCPFIQVLSVNVSVFTLSAIALDRYRAVLHPLSARSSKRRATLAIVTIWAVGILIALPTELDFRVIVKVDKDGLKPFCENTGLSKTFRKYYLLGLVVIQYFLPLCVITGAYVRMATRLWGTTAPGNAAANRDAAILKNKKKVIKMLAVVVLLFALCWLPLQTYNFFQPFIPAINDYQYINIIWFCFHWLAMSNSCCNPFIYAIYNDKFQREFRARLRAMKFCSGHRADSPNSEVSDFDRSKIRASYRFHDVRHQQHRNNGENLEYNPNRQSNYRTAQYQGPRRNLNYHLKVVNVNNTESSMSNKKKNCNGSRNGNIRFEEETALTVHAQNPPSPSPRSFNRTGSLDSKCSSSNNDFSQ